MNHFAHYDRLIDRARSRGLCGYRERHHVVPRCMGGDDAPANLVELTAREHFVAHLFLMMMYPHVNGLVTAVGLMTRKAKNSRRYDWLRRRHAAAVSAMKTGKRRPEFSAEWRARISAANKGRKQSPESIAKSAAARRGMTHKPATRERISIAMRGNKRGVGRSVSQETRARHAENQRGKKASLETRKKLSAAHAGKSMPPRTDDHSSKIWAARRANKNDVPTVPVGKSGFRCVYLHDRGGAKIWRAAVKINGQQKTIGYYATPEEASAAAEVARAQRRAVVEGCSRIPTISAKP